MRAFLIDPEARTLTTIEYDGNFKSIYDLIDCHTFDVARFNDAGDVVYVDDEGLFNPTSFFLIEGYPQPLAGKGLLLGTDEEGDTCEPTVSEAWLRENLDFGHPLSTPNGVLFMGDRNIREIA